MRSRRQQHREKQQALRIQRDRRRLGRFVAFAEIEADLTPVLLVEQNPAKTQDKLAEVQSGDRP